jgi:endonuclease/exonuclease/phosphatase (EEP) superfamily protein YafD
MREQGPLKPLRGWRLALLIASAVPALGIVISLSDPWWPGQLCVNWSLHLALALLPALMLLGRRRALGGPLILLMVLGWLPWLRAGLEPNLPAPAGERIRVVSANVKAKSPLRTQAIAAAVATGADLVCLVEPLPRDRSLLADDPEWPYQYWSDGLTLLSKRPLLHPHALGFGIIGAHLQWSDGSTLRIIALHPLHPIYPSWQRERDKELRHLADFVLAEPGPTLVMGDLNTSAGCAAWRELHGSSGLERPAHETASWPSCFGWAGIGIDHLLGRGIAMGPTSPVWLPGSDHRAVTAEVGLLH